MLVDDCSTDGSFEVLEKNTREDTRVFRLETNSGSSTARNFGISQTDADFIFCLDQDDVLFQNSLKTLLNSIQINNVSWVYGDFLRSSKNLSYHIGDDYFGYQFANPSELLTSIFLGEHFFQQNSLYSKELFEKNGGFDKDILTYQDLDLCIRFALAGENPLYLPGPLYIHRLHENNLSKVSGREGNLLAHKDDLKQLYQVYARALKEKVNSFQMEKITSFLS